MGLESNLKINSKAGKFIETPLHRHTQLSD